MWQKLIGLLKKEFYDLLEMKKNFIVLFVVLEFFGFMVSNLELVSVINLLLLPSILVESFFNDEKNGWDKFAATFPLGSQTIVFSKYVSLYLFIIVLSMGLLIINSIINLVIFNVPISSLFKTIAVVASFDVFFYSLYYMIIYKFGVSKSKSILVLLIVIPSFSFSAICYFSAKYSLDIIDISHLLDFILNFKFGSFHLIVILICSIVLSVCFSLLSIKTYNKKVY